MTTKFRTIQSKFQQPKRRLQLMSQSGVIVHRKADTFPPNEFWEKVLAENTSAWGAVICSEADDQKFLELFSGETAISLEDVQATLTEFKDQGITWYFCNSTAAISLKDISPYILIATAAEDDPEVEEPRVVAFFDGNFPGYEKTGSSHPPEYHLASDVLVPKLEAIFEMVDGDIDKMMEALKKPIFNKEMLSYSVSRGTITLVASNGVLLNYAQNDLAREFPWGWTSNHYGFGEAAPAADLPKKKPGLFKRGTVSTVREKPPTAAIAEAVKPTPTVGSVIKNWTVKKEKPGGHLSRSETKDWYKSKIGYLPTDWFNKPMVNVYIGPDQKVSTFAQMNKALGMEAAGLVTLADNPPREVGKNTQPDKVDGKTAQAAETEKPVSVAPTPVMSPKGREFINTLRSTDQYKKIIAENAEVINDPKQAEGYETRFVDFAKQMGAESMEEFALWDFEMRLDLCQKRPHEAAVMLDTFSNILIRNGFFKGKKIEAQKEETPTVTTKKPGLFKRSAA